MHRLGSRPAPVPFVGAFALVAILAATGGASASPAHVAGPGPSASGATWSAAPAAGTVAPLNATLAVNTSSVNLSGDFWGTTVNNEVHLLRGESNAVNATPTRVLVWPGAMAGEDYDPLTETHYDTYSGAANSALTTESQFVTMCTQIHCTAIVQVPAEIDSTSIAEAIVNYTERNLSFHPAFWMIGNEPELWSHWKVPWSRWGSSYTGGPTPTQFGQEVVAYVKAIRAVDNTTPILGLPASGCTCGYWTFEQWISGVLKVTGNLIQAVAFHEYPAGWLGTGDGSLLDFYGTIQSAANIPTRMVGARQAVQSSCSGCNVSVFISELGAALSWSAYGQYAAGFSGALSIASQLTQAMADNVTNVDLFAAELNTTNSWFNPHGYARPDYGLYTQILNHLGTEAFSVKTTGLAQTIYAIDTVAPNDGGRQDLLVMNDNITHAVQFTPAFAGGYEGAAVEAWSWNGSIHTTHANSTTWVEPYTASPVPQAYPDGLPSSYVLPPQSLVLLESYPAGASYVQVTASGVPAGVPWYASIGSRFYTSTAPNVSLLLPAGSYPVAGVGIPLPIGGKAFHPVEQLGAFVSSPAVVEGSAATISLAYVPQWKVNISAVPAAGGTVSAGPDWWNESTPLPLTVAANPGFAFERWNGWGPGNYSGPNRSIAVDPAGPVHERAIFVSASEVDFGETGLPAGTPWSVTVRGETVATGNQSLTVYAPNGTWGFTASQLPGYRTIPTNGSFYVDTPWSYVTVRYVPIRPPQPDYPVTFHLTGLPTGTPVSLTVRNVQQTMGQFDPRFELSNGTYAFEVGFTPGYHVALTNKTFQVAGGPLNVDVPFVRTMYAVTWQTFGARAGMNWSVEIAGQTLRANSSWLSTMLANGSYPYRITLPVNFTTNALSGIADVSGYAARVFVYLSLAEFPVDFVASGAGGTIDWSVRLANVTQGAAANGSLFFAPNGSYTFDVHPPPGYYAVPSHGVVAVSGAGAPVRVQFLLTTHQPSSALVASLSANAVVVSGWIGASVFVGFSAFRWLLGRGGRSR